MRSESSFFRCHLMVFDNFKAHIELDAKTCNLL
jgi:hypothetical protein